MIRRQLQKLPGSRSAASASPAMARWNAWLCRLGMPGSTGPSSRSAPDGSAPGSTAAKSPVASSTVNRTSRAQPSGNSADSANSTVIDRFLRYDQRVEAYSGDEGDGNLGQPVGRYRPGDDE